MIYIRINSPSTKNTVQPSCITSKSREKQNAKRNITSQIDPAKDKNLYFFSRFLLVSKLQFHGK
jgi:hypothetical protein